MTKAETDYSTPLLGRVALVTGSAKRTGRAIVTRLADLGATVVVNAVTSMKPAEVLVETINSKHGPGRCIAWQADVTDAVAVQEMIDGIGSHFGRLDILVNNAAVRRNKPLLEITLEDWHSVLRATLDGSLLCAQAAVPYLKLSSVPRIINIGGISAHVGASGHLPQMVAKAGVIGITRGLALELGAFGITVNCVCPGTIISKDDPAERVEFLTEFLEKRSTPFPRPGTVEEIAEVVADLCQDTWRYMTGQVIHINGGAYFGS